MSKAAQVLGKPTPAPRSFMLGPTAFTERWRLRPTSAIPVGLRRIAAEDRVIAHVKAIARADRMMPEDRRSPEDPLWQRVYEITLVHYVLGFALCNPVDVNLPLWPAQDGHTMLIDLSGDEIEYGACPVASARFTDDGIARCLDELDILARKDPVTMRRASDADLVRVGAVLADGSFFARLKSADTEETRAVGEHIRMLTGAILDLMERGREAPLSIGG